MPSLLVVEVEALFHPRFWGDACALRSQGRLATIFLDEVHAALDEAAFRPTMDRLRDLRRLSRPMALMSATLPPDMCSTLLQKLGISPSPADTLIRRSSSVQTPRRKPKKHRTNSVLLCPRLTK